MYLRRPKRVMVPRGVLLDDELLEGGLDVLEVGEVAGGSEDGGGSYWVQTLDGFEPGEGAVGC